MLVPARDDCWSDPSIEEESLQREESFAARKVDVEIQIGVDEFLADACLSFVVNLHEECYSVHAPVGIVKVVRRSWRAATEQYQEIAEE